MLDSLYVAVAKVSNIVMVTRDTEIPDNCFSAEVNPDVTVHVGLEVTSYPNS